MVRPLRTMKDRRLPILCSTWTSQALIKALSGPMYQKTSSFNPTWCCLYLNAILSEAAAARPFQSTSGSTVPARSLSEQDLMPKGQCGPPPHTHTHTHTHTYTQTHTHTHTQSKNQRSLKGIQLSPSHPCTSVCYEIYFSEWTTMWDVGECNLLLSALPLTLCGIRWISSDLVMLKMSTMTFARGGSMDLVEETPQHPGKRGVAKDSDQAPDPTSQSRLDPCDQTT